MPGTTRAEIRTLKVGRYVSIDDSAYKILSMSKSKPGKHGSAKARIELEDIFTGQKRSHVGTVTDNINIPIIEKGSAIITHIQGSEVHAMDNKTYETLILPVDSELKNSIIFSFDFISNFPSSCILYRLGTNVYFC